MVASDDELVTEVLVRGLLADQHPDLAELPLSLVGEGWDNRVYRLGDDLTARLPTRAVAAPLIDHELTWVPRLVEGLPGPGDGGLLTSAPQRAGEPGRGYPWRWMISRWIPGRPLVEAPLDDPVADAGRLGRFLRGIHRPAPPDTPPNPHRGVPLGDRVETFDHQLARLDDLGRSLPPGVAGRARSRLHEVASTSAWIDAPRSLHGDPHVQNLIVDDGRLVGLIDFGDITSGDPASDLTPAWLVFDGDARLAFQEPFGYDAATWLRAEGWAIALAVAYVAGAPDGSPLIGVGRDRLAAMVD